MLSFTYDDIAVDPSLKGMYSKPFLQELMIKGFVQNHQSIQPFPHKIYRVYEYLIFLALNCLAFIYNLFLLKTHFSTILITSVSL